MSKCDSMIDLVIIEDQNDLYYMVHCILCTQKQFSLICQGNFEFLESQENVREFHNFCPKMFGL